MITIYDLAQKAGVSASTVSRVINHKGHVKPETEQRVRMLLESEKFSKSEIASSLATRSSKTIALLATDIREQYYTQIAYAIETGMAPKGYYSMFCSMGRDPRRQIDYIQAMLARRMKVLVYIGSPAHNADLTTALLEASRKVPVCVTNGLIPGENIYSLIRDDAGSVRLCVEHLLARGCRHIAFVSDFCFTSDLIKQSAYQDLMSAHHMPSDEFRCGRSLHEILAFADQLCQKEIPHDGYVCTNDLIAAGLIKGLSTHGYRLPEQIKITGCDNDPIGDFTHLTLTTVDYDLTRQEAILLDMLTKLCEGHSVEQNSYLISPTLVVRESTRG